MSRGLNQCDICSWEMCQVAHGPGLRRVVCGPEVFLEAQLGVPWSNEIVVTQAGSVFVCFEAASTITLAWASAVEQGSFVSFFASVGCP